jgi:hypothetical protein
MALTTLPSSPLTTRGIDGLQDDARPRMEVGPQQGQDALTKERRGSASGESRFRKAHTDTQHTRTDRVSM